MLLPYLRRSAKPLDSSDRAKDDCDSTGLMQVSNFITLQGKYAALGSECAVRIRTIALGSCFDGAILQLDEGWTVVW